MLAKLLLTLSLSLMLTGCLQTRISGIEAEALTPLAVCDVWPIIRPSRQDTADTIRQATASNAARRGWGC